MSDQLSVEVEQIGDAKKVTVVFTPVQQSSVEVDEYR